MNEAIKVWGTRDVLQREDVEINKFYFLERMRPVGNGQVTPELEMNRAESNSSELESIGIGSARNLA
jgi:hypothetical protein